MRLILDPAPKIRSFRVRLGLLYIRPLERRSAGLNLCSWIIHPLRTRLHEIIVKVETSFDCMGAVLEKEGDAVADAIELRTRFP